MSRGIGIYNILTIGESLRKGWGEITTKYKQLLGGPGMVNLGKRTVI